MTNALLNPSNFVWAKSLLESKAWDMIIKVDPSETSISFSIPKRCPSKEPIKCSSESSVAVDFLFPNEPIKCSSESSVAVDFLFPEKQEDIVGTSITLKRKFGKAPLVSSEVRRSQRIKNYNGFKSKSCLSKNYFCCSTEAPTLSTKVIRNLGPEFCKIPSSKLSDDGLKKKNVPKKHAGNSSKQDNPKIKNQVKDVASLSKKPKKK
jgi:hypothetical protein